MFARSASALAATFALLLLAACATPAPQEPASYSFDQSAPIFLKVSGIEVRNQFVEPGYLPNVEHAMDLSPSAGLIDWAGARIAAAGGNHQATFLIKDASMVETQLEMTSGIEGAFTTEPSQRYDLRMEVELQITNQAGAVVGKVFAEVTRSQEVLEDRSDAERKEIWHAMTQQALDDLSAELEPTIRRVLVDYLAG